MDGTIVHANRAFLQLCGLTPAALGEQHFQRVLPPSGAIFYEIQFLPILLLRGAVKEVALDLLHISGERIPVLLNANLNRDSAGRPSGMRIALFEATERRLYERELLHTLKEAEQTATVVRRSSEAILTLSPDGLIQNWNNGAEGMFGYAAADAVGKSFIAQLFPQAERMSVAETVNALGAGRDISCDLVGVTKGGREFEISMSLTPHMEAPGILVAFSAIIRDISSRKMAERALIQSEKLASVGRLATSIAHEINNPLESVTNLLYLLDNELPEGELKSFANSARDELARVSHIVTHTLRFHRQSSDPTLVDIRELMNSVIDLYRTRLKNSNIDVQFRNADASRLYCLEGELRQVVANLVSNAFDAMRGGGRLIMTARDCTLWRSSSKGLRMFIVDTGVGMDGATLARLYEPFFSTKGIGGTGLGMWIAQELVEKNGGSIRIRTSIRPGRSGTAVMLAFRHRELR
jgi:PAS domain S-box-containing protein